MIRLATFTLSLCLFTALSTLTFAWAGGSGHTWRLTRDAGAPDRGPDPTDFGARLKVEKVLPSLKNRREQGELSKYTQSVQCSTFQGSHAGNTVVFQAEGTGGSGKYRHNLIYTLSGFSQGHDPSGKQIHMSRSGNGHFKISLPDLREEVPFVQLTVSLITEDRMNPDLSAMDQMTFRVSRQVILSKSTSPAVLEKECFERYLPHESGMGLISNGTSTPSTLQISHGFQKSWTSTQGWQVGVYFSPVAYFGFGNPIFGNIGYFRQTAKQTIETVNIATGHEIPPGAFMQVFIQPTRYIRAYDATLVDHCGETKKLEGAYFFQWWGYSHLLAPVNPKSTAKTDAENIGAPAINTCSEALNVLPTGETSGDLEFLSTDIE